MNTATRWKVAKADEYAVMDASGVIANCDSTAYAAQIVREHNAVEAMRELVAQAAMYHERGNLEATAEALKQALRLANAQEPVSQ